MDAWWVRMDNNEAVGMFIEDLDEHSLMTTLEKATSQEK